MKVHNLKAALSDDSGIVSVIWCLDGFVIDEQKLTHLAAYIKRIGAKPYNFRTFGVVKRMPDGYFREVARIRIVGSELKVSGIQAKEYAPIKGEVDRITVELEAAKERVPKSLPVGEAKLHELRKMVSGQGTLYVIPTRRPKYREQDIAMVEERIDLPDGSKKCLPWSFWDDGVWRRMLPDGPIPFWKPRKATDRNLHIMIHEGPKVAKAVTELLEKPAELAKHPFGAVLARYEHWGMLGGAYHAPNADWEELRAAKPAEVIYVCDNDYAGKMALQDVSAHYSGPLTGVKFDDQWPMGFDLADKMPPKLFAATGRYTGPKWEQLLVPATWATKTIQPDGKGRPSHVISHEFAQEWSHAVTPEVFVHRLNPTKIFNPNEFNNFIRPFSDVDDTARLVKRISAAKAVDLAYEPGKPPGIFVDEGTRATFFNTFTPSLIKPEKGDITLWAEFMKHLVPNEEERKEVYRWCATLVARPDIKMLWGLLLISEEQGIGKGTLGERILAPLVGVQNVSVPSENEIVDSNYNYWLSHKRLAVVHEIYAGHSTKAYNKLKSIITDKTVTVLKKYQANYDIKNWIHVLACSNSKNALQLAEDDRRWYVPKLTDQKRDRPYWQMLNAWLTEGGGLEAIAYWAHECVAKHGPVLTGDAPLMTEAKKDVIKDGYTKGQIAIVDRLQALVSKAQADAEHGIGRDIVTTDVALQTFVRFHVHESREDRVERLGKLRNAAQTAEWYVSKKRVPYGRHGYAHVISTNPALIARVDRGEASATDLMNSSSSRGPNRSYTFLDDLNADVAL